MGLPKLTDDEKLQAIRSIETDAELLFRTKTFQEFSSSIFDSLSTLSSTQELMIEQNKKLLSKFEEIILDPKNGLIVKVSMLETTKSDLEKLESTVETLDKKVIPLDKFYVSVQSAAKWVLAAIMGGVITQLISNVF